MAGAPEPLPSAPEPAVVAPLEAVPPGRVVLVGPMPEGLVFDVTTGLVVIGLRSPDGVVLVDRDGQLVRRVDLDGAPRHLALAGPGGPVLAPAEGSDQLVTVSLPDGRIESVVPVGRNPHDAVAVGRRVYVGNEFADSVSVVDDGKVVDEIPAPVQPGGIGASGDAVAVVGVRGRQTKVFGFDISGSEPRPVADFASVRQPNSIAVDPETGTVYLAGTADGVLQIVTPGDLG